MKLMISCSRALVKNWVNLSCDRILFLFRWHDPVLVRQLTPWPYRCKLAVELKLALSQKCWLLYTVPAPTKLNTHFAERDNAFCFPFHAAFSFHRRARGILGQLNAQPALHFQTTRDRLCIHNFTSLLWWMPTSYKHDNLCALCLPSI